MNKPHRLDAYRLVAESARVDGDWWIARGDEVARWWRSRSEARVAFAPADGASLPLSMSPSGISDLVVSGADLEDVWIDVVVPDRCEALVPLVDGHSVAFAATEWGIRVPVGTLTAGIERRISLVHASAKGEHPAPGR